MNKFCPRYSHEKRPVIFQYRSSDLIQQSILTQLAYNRGHNTYTVAPRGNSRWKPVHRVDVGVHELPGESHLSISRLLNDYGSLHVILLTGFLTLSCAVVNPESHRATSWARRTLFSTSVISPQVIPIQLKAPLIPTQVKSLHHFVE
jgi:hypothetical protein